MSFHTFQHQFWLFCDRPNHVTWKYRKFSTDSWLPEAGQNQIELFDLDITGDNTIPRLVQTEDPGPSCITEMLESEGLIREIKTKKKKKEKGLILYSSVTSMQYCWFTVRCLT
ncbi:Hypothetical predicted protein [Mytilus galloprovincialis]|uniref:Uncharacterized protein n=1 Tax=Mytilus galloprovincialis TaxID=29158 RepID=A0A8B6GV98_MYTGA|nr:Hypothetical predicted protein [Mytilus galloprovincialis]